jgi:hypothetical protein
MFNGFEVLYRLFGYFFFFKKEVGYMSNVHVGIIRKDILKANQPSHATPTLNPRRKQSFLLDAFGWLILSTNDLHPLQCIWQGQCCK